jgi:hypothetical protein
MRISNAEKKRREILAIKLLILLLGQFNCTGVSSQYIKKRFDAEGLSMTYAYRARRRICEEVIDIVIIGSDPKYYAWKIDIQRKIPGS